MPSFPRLPRPRSLRDLWSTPTFSGSAVNVYSTGLNIVGQLVSVPIYSAAFGVREFGVWLLITTIPFYLLLSDVGFTAAVTNDMAMKAGAGRQGEVLAVFQSYGLFMTLIATLVAAAALLGIPMFSWLGGHWPSALAPHVSAIMLLVGYAAFGLTSMLPVSAFRATGFYALGTAVADTLAFLEILASMICAWLTHDLEFCALLLMLGRATTTLVLYVVMRRRVPYLFAGYRHASRAEVRRLLPSALGNMAIPAGLSISLQGTVAVVGAVLGPGAVAVFVPVRTASRLTLQAAGIVIRAVVPQLAAAYGRGDDEAEARYWSYGRWLTIGLLVPGAIGFALLGGWLVGFWTHGLIRPPHSLVAIAGLSVVFHGVWFYGVTLLSACDQHRKVAKLIPIASLLGLAAAPFLCSAFGVSGAALSMIVGDAILAGCVAPVVWAKGRRPA